MDPWSVVLNGAKAQILAVVAKTEAIPSEVQAAVIALFALHPEVPGWSDEDPAEIWERTVPHTSADIPPPKRDDMWTSSWRLETSGHPDKQGSTIVAIHPVRSAK